MTESFGGKQELIYFFPGGGEFDGMANDTFPDDVTADALVLFIRATGIALIALAVGKHAGRVLQGSSLAE